jgi:high affinity choline transporter 7
MMLGGMWSVAYTDVFQLALVAIGLAVAVPFALGGAGGFDRAWGQYAAARPEGIGILPSESVLAWSDVSLMLIFGGIPWNCYFQRVLSCQSPRKAQWHSIIAGTLTIAFTIPPLLLGVAAFSYPWTSATLARLEATPAETLPMLLAHAVPPIVGIFGLVAIVGAVTSSFSSSILSAGSMLSWNCVKRLIRPSMSVTNMKLAIRLSILLLGGAATALALKVQSVQALWFFTSDLVFVLLFPQLVFALFDRKVNRTGSMTAFAVSFILRIGAGEPLLGIPAFLAYPASFPFRAVAAAAGIILLVVVSRATAAWDPPSLPIMRPSVEGSFMTRSMMTFALVAASVLSGTVATAVAQDVAVPEDRRIKLERTACEGRRPV